MKNSIFVLAVALILVVAMAGESISRGTPVSYRDPACQDGDDHTWGGENGLIPGGCLNSTAATGYFPIDFLINAFGDRNLRSVIIIGIIGTPITSVTDTNRDATTTSNRGN
ncbi:MAG TPA: hypothetical protein PLF13_01005 [candidate division Zixibacteria bacterium]|nr:hypothetical protein [candidate division Zixibacteria bacterium]